MSPIRTYRMTIGTTTRSYDKDSRGAASYEVHFRVSRRGEIRKIRQILANRGIEYFERYMHRHLGSYVPLRSIRVRFEREQPALKATKEVQAEGRYLFFRGRRWSATPLGKGRFVYARKRKARRRRKKIGKRRKHRSKRRRA